MSANYGLVCCGKTQRGVKHPEIPGFERINAASNGPAAWKNLSPMLIGPLVVTEPINCEMTNTVDPGYSLSSTKPGKQEAICHRFENFWQGGKLFRSDYGLDLDSDLSGINLDEQPFLYQFYLRRAKMYSSEKGKRRALPKAKAGVPIHSIYFGQRMGYIQSRKEVYCPIYAGLVLSMPEYAAMYSKVLSGINVLIVGPDGRDIEMTRDSVEQAINDPKYIFGHELVLACLLSGFMPWLTDEQKSQQETHPAPIPPSSVNYNDVVVDVW